MTFNQYCNKLMSASNIMVVLLNTENSKRKGTIMKKILMIAAAAILVGMISGCGSLRTPKEGPRKGNVYYQTFFGLSLESLVYGDGAIVGQK